MTEQEINKILREYEGWDGNPMYFDKPDYTTDWNDFHRVWMKFLQPEIKDKVTDGQTQVAMLILNNDTPLHASKKLAEIIKKER